MLRMGISVVILYLVNTVAAGNTQMAYIYVGVIIIIIYFSQLIKQSSYLKSYILASRIKSSLAMLLYARISSLTSYVIKNSQLGKITNLLASDFGIIEMRIVTFLASFAYPVYAVGTTTLLVTRLGWPGVVALLLVILTLPLSNCVSKRNGAIVSEINAFKDKRIQTTT
jgi:ATP-binding cassette subfamily C (CFTR/MRP) protein 4